MHTYLLIIYKQIVDAFLNWLKQMSLRNTCCWYLIMWLILVVKLVIKQLANDIFIMKSNWLELDISRTLDDIINRGRIQWTAEVLKKCNTLLKTFNHVFGVTTVTISLILDFFIRDIIRVLKRLFQGNRRCCSTVEDFNPYPSKERIHNYLGLSFWSIYLWWPGA